MAGVYFVCAVCRKGYSERCEKRNECFNMPGMWKENAGGAILLMEVRMS